MRFIYRLIAPFIFLAILSNQKLSAQRCRVYCSDGSSYLVDCNTTVDPCSGGSKPVPPKPPVGPTKKELEKEEARNLNHYGVLENEKGRNCWIAEDWDCAILHLQEAINYYQKAYDKDKNKTYKENLDGLDGFVNKAFCLKFIAQGVAKYNQQQYADAESVYRVALRYDPANANAHVNLGLALEMQERYGEAIAEYKAALKIDPKTPGENENIDRAMQKEDAFPNKGVIGMPAEIKGDVKISRNGGEAFSAKSGIPLRAGDRIITGNNSKLQTILLDGTAFTMGQNSDMVLDDFVYDPKTTIGKISINVIKGAMRFITGKVAGRNPNAFQVKTPVGSLGRRGTDFQIKIGADTVGTVYVYEGSIVITEKRTGRQIEVSEGQMIEVRPWGFATIPVSFTPEEKKDAISRLN
jgi:hypothetical protein